MATPSTLAGQHLYIKIADSNSPGTWAHPCLINAERGLSLTSQANDVYIPDCDDPDIPAIREHIKTAVEAAVNGAGILDTAALATWLPWHKSDDTKLVQVWFGTVGYIQMAMKLDAFEVTGDRGGKVQVNVSLMSHGEIGDYTAA